MRRQNWWLFLLVAFLWGLNWSAMKVGLSFASPTAFILHRLVFAAATLLPFMLLMRRKIPTNRDTLGKLLVYSLIYVSHILTLQIGLSYESSGLSSVLTFTQPLFVFCLALAFLNEKISTLKFLGVILGFGGVVVVLLVDKISSLTFSSSFGARFLLILSGLLWAFLIVYYKKFLGHVAPLIATFFQLSIGVLPLTVLGLSTGDIALPVASAYLGVTLYSSVASLAIGTAIWNFLLKQEETIVLSGSSFLIPVIAMLL